MENYKRGKRVEQEINRENIPIPNLPDDFTWMQLTAGSRMKNILCYAMNSMNRGKAVVWTGVGSNVGKAVSCAEILKRKFNAHQITKICYRRIEEYWEPTLPKMETIIVKREIPTIHILVSRQPLDVNESGYQSPTDCKGFYRPTVVESSIMREPICSVKQKKQADAS